MHHKAIRTIRDQVYHILKGNICDGTYKPGQWLQEVELAAQLNVSRSPVREALRQLAADGLVVEYPNKGVYVKEVTQRDVREIFELRVLMENHAISKLRGSLSTTGIEQLLACLKEMEHAYEKDNLRQYTKVDARLHELLIQLSGNSLLESTYSRMLSMVQQFRIYSLIDRKRFDESLEEHRGIVYSILRGEYARAQEINHMHLQLAREKILEHLDQRSEQDESSPPERPI